MKTTTKTKAQERAQRLITALSTEALTDSYYTNAIQMEATRGTAAYGAFFVIHMWISDEIETRLGEPMLLAMENTAFGELD